MYFRMKGSRSVRLVFTLLMGANLALSAGISSAQENSSVRKSTPTSRTADPSNQTRFFSNKSFWNQPLPADPEIDPRSAYWIGLMKTDRMRNFGVNATRFTIPIYEVNENTALKIVHENSTFYHHWKGLEERLPIPDDAVPDAQSDAHMALIDRPRNLVWDMWLVRKVNGEWYSNTGIRYSLDGPGDFISYHLGMKNGDSVHQYGPSRAAGVPIIAGLALYDEAASGVIEHKIAAATRFVAHQEFVYPAIWTDGTCDGGIPEGSVIQLDPALDLSQFKLTAEEQALARAMQKYGMVLVDYAGGNVVYAEGVYGHAGKSWQGRIREWDGGLISIPIENYRVLAIKNSIHEGDVRYQEVIPLCANGPKKSVR